MVPVKDFINKIRWDKNLDKERYSLHYTDRITNSIKTMKFNEILAVEGDFLVLEDKEIPLHRIRKITMFEKIVWER